MNPLEMELIPRKAYNAYTAQISKSYNSKDPSYKYYGGKGVKVHYSRMDFVRWYLYQYSKNPLKDPSVGRIDHDSHYCFHNIELQDFNDNRRERARRVGMPDCSRKIAVYEFPESKEPMASCKSITDASHLTGASITSIIRVINGTIRSAGRGKKMRGKGFFFKYLG